MPNKTIDEKIDALALAVGRGFEEVHGKMDSGFKFVHEKMDKGFKEVNARLDSLDEKIDKVDSKVTGLAGRVDVLEDQMRMVRTKLGFN